MSEHRSITVQRDMLAIVELWPALRLRLERGGSGDRSGVRTAPTSTPPIDLHTSDLIAEVTSWAFFLARVLQDEVTVERGGRARPWSPADTTMPAMLAEIARWRVGHFTEHEDELLAAAIADDAAEFLRRVRAVVSPSGARRVDLRIPCLEHGTSDLGERVPCAGTYRTTLIPGRPLGDMVCSEDATHRMTPAEWQAAQRHRRLDQGAVRRLLGGSA